MELTLKKPQAQIFFPVTSNGNLSDTTHLCIAAHQDDIELMAAGAILECFGKKDKAFTGVVVTDGAGSPRNGVYAGCLDEDMKKLRANEQNLAASIGRYNAQLQLGYTSSEVKDKSNNGLVSELEEIIRLTRPDFVFTHNPADKHDTHCAVFLKTLLALRKIPAGLRPKAVYAMEGWRSLDWLCNEDKILFDTSDNEFTQSALVGVYHSQIAGGKRYDLAGMGRKLANATYFAGHCSDNFSSVEYGLDITGLVNDETLSPVDFIDRYIDKFRDDVNERLAKLM